MKRVLCIWLPHGPAPRTPAARPERDQRQAVEELEELAAWCRQFSPLVGVEDSPDPQCVFLDVTGLEHLFGDEASLGQRILDALDARGLEARVAIADTLGAAWAAAHFDFPSPLSLCGRGAGGEGAVRRVGRSPTDPSADSPRWDSLRSSHPTILPPGQSQTALRPLPIEALRLPPDTVERLHSVGIQRIEQLEVLPREDLAPRFGSALVDRWDQATGRRGEPIPALPPVQVFRARQDLEYPTARREILAPILQRLIARLARMLLASGRGAMRIDCRLDSVHGDCPDFRGGAPCAAWSRENGTVPLWPDGGHSPPYGLQFSVGLFRPSASPQHLLGLVEMRLERLRLAGPVTAVSVEAPATAPLEHRQEELFDLDGCGPRRWSRRLLAALVDRLAGRLGCRAVLRPRLLPEAQPELAYRYDPLVSTGFHPNSPTRLKYRPGWPGQRVGWPGQGNGWLGQSEAVPQRRVGWSGQSEVVPQRRVRRSGQSETVPQRRRTGASLRSAASHPADWPPRPLRLLDEPVPLSVVSLVPDGPPLRFSFRGQEHRIAQVWGPERIEIGWWRGPMVARDYYCVETAAGQRYWLFRRLADGRWFLHGTFE